MTLRGAAVLLSLLEFSISASGQAPVIGTKGVVNGASFAPVGLPNSSIAPGSIASIFGLNLSPGVTKKYEAFPLPTSADFVKVEVAAGGRTYDAILLAISPMQLNVIVPSAVPPGTAQFTVVMNGARSNSEPVTIVPNSPGLFTWMANGSGPVRIHNASFREAERVVLTQAANPGETMNLYGTGFGAVQGAEAAGPLPGPQNWDVTVFVGGRQAQVLYKGRSGCCAGLDQVQFVVPEGVTGCYVPIQVRVNGVISNTGSVSIAPRPGRACSDPLTFAGKSADQFVNGSKIGAMMLSRTSLKFQGVDFGTDVAFADFSDWKLDNLINSSGAYGVSTFGACSTYTYRGGDSEFQDPVQPTGLDAGNPLTLVLPAAGGTKALDRVAGEPGTYATELFSGGAPWLGSGNYTIQVPGGTGVRQFAATLTVPNELVWTNYDAVTDVVRANGVQVNWAGGQPNDIVLISGISDSGGVGAGFYCLEQASRNGFRVPPEVLSILPVTGPSEDDSGMLFLAMLSAPERSVITPTPGGLDLATFGYLFTTGKMVPYK